MHRQADELSSDSETEHARNFALAFALGIVLLVFAGFAYLALFAPKHQEGQTICDPGADPSTVTGVEPGNKSHCPKER